MNKRFVKNNIGLLAVVSVCAVVATGLLIFTLIEYVQMYVCISKIEDFRKQVGEIIAQKPAPVDDNRPLLNQYKTMRTLSNYLKKQDLVERFAVFADQNGLKRRNLMIMKSHDLLERYIDSRIIYNMLDEQAWNEFMNLDDPTIRAALEVIRKNQTFPKK